MIRDQQGFPKEGRFYKGNLHCHCANSDGAGTPAQRVADYQAAGYDFLALTDHDYYTDLPELSSDQFLLLPAAEIHCPPYEDECLYYHIVGIAKPGENTFENGKLTYDPAWRANDLIKYLESHGNFAIVAHPYWSQMRGDAYCQLEGAVGLEVFNGISHFEFGTGFSEYAVDEAIYRGKYPLLFAADDYHWAPFREVPDHFVGYVMVKAPQLSHEAIVCGLLEGQFYASFCGPEIYNYEIRDGKVIVETSPCRQICLRSPRIYGSTRYSFNDDLTYAEFPLKGDEKVVRVVVMDKEGHTSWTQILPVIQE